MLCLLRFRLAVLRRGLLPWKSSIVKLLRGKFSCRICGLKNIPRLTHFVIRLAQLYFLLCYLVLLSLIGLIYNISSPCKFVYLAFILYRYSLFLLYLLFAIFSTVSALYDLLV